MAEGRFIALAELLALQHGAMRSACAQLTRKVVRDLIHFLHFAFAVVVECVSGHPAAGAVADGCFGALAELLAPQHGAVRETAALALRPLAPGLLGSSAAGGVGKTCSRGGASTGRRAGAAIRARILAFAGEALQCARGSQCSSKSCGLWRCL